MTKPVCGARFKRFVLDGDWVPGPGTLIEHVHAYPRACRACREVYWASKYLPMHLRCRGRAKDFQAMLPNVEQYLRKVTTDLAERVGVNPDHVRLVYKRLDGEWGWHVSINYLCKPKRVRKPFNYAARGYAVTLPEAIADAIEVYESADDRVRPQR